MTNVVEFEHKVIPAGTKTDQELIDQGRSIVNRTGRALGEWFNEVKLNKSDAAKVGNEQGDIIALLMTAQQICAKAGVKYSTAKDYGAVAEAFSTVESQRGFSYSACNIMMPILRELGPEEFFGRFMSDAVAGLPYLGEHDPEWEYTAPYCTKDLNRAKFYITRQLRVGSADPSQVPETAEPELATEFADGVLSKLPAKTQEAALRELRKILKAEQRTLEKSFSDEVERCAQIKIYEKTDKLRKKLREAEKEAQIELERLQARAASTRAIFTKPEYRLIRGCLVSDKQPEEQRRRFDDAMAIFVRLKRACDHG
jgi:hypothetical protein